jgi:signal transduction histidine kinase/ligand-binding sensor domain-containing protein
MTIINRHVNPWLMSALFRVLFVLLMAWPMHLYALSARYAAENLTITRLTADHGLSQGTIRAIAQDHLGFMWFGTNDGLNRYDGYRFKVFRHQTGSNSISSNMVNTIVVDDNGKLWIGTAQGLNTFDPATGIFTCYHDGPLTKNCYVSTLAFDLNGILWIGTHDQGLMSLNPSAGKVQAFLPVSVDGLSAEPFEIFEVFVDSGNRIWVSTLQSSLLLFDPEKETFTEVDFTFGTGPEGQNPYVSGIVEGPDATLWLAVYGGGLVKMDPATQLCERFGDLTFVDAYQWAVWTTTGLAIEQDHIFWIITEGYGVIRYDMLTGERTNFSHGPGRQHVAYYNLLSIFIDRDDHIWLGTHGHGINLVNPRKLPLITVSSNSLADIQTDLTSFRGVIEVEEDVYWLAGYYGIRELDLKRYTITSMLSEDWGSIFVMHRDLFDDRVYWIGTEGKGLLRYNKQNKSVTRMNFVGLETNMLGMTDAIVGQSVYSITQLPDSSLLIGTDRGLNIIQAKNRTNRFFRHDPENPESIPAGNILSLFVDSESSIWVGSSIGGMALFDLDQGTFKRHVHIYSVSDDGPLFEKAFRVNCFYEDSKGRFWTGTNMGLHLHSRSEDTCMIYLASDGLPNDFIYGILEDEFGRLWLSTNAGLSCFDPDQETFINYDKDDGLPGNEFNTGSYYQADKSRLFFGGVDGLVVLMPEQFMESRLIPAPVLSRVVKYAGASEKLISTPDQETLVWDRHTDMITLEFSSLNYLNPGKSRYAYRIDYLGDHLINLNEQRQITLTRPRPGNYHIQIYASDRHNQWGPTPAIINLSVLPRFYETVSFRFFLLFILFIMIMLVFKIRTQAVNRQRHLLKLTVDEKTRELKTFNEALTKSNKTKDKFFSIIAHDLKSPFNAFLGFTELLDGQWDVLSESRKRRYVGLIRKTAESTYNLLLQLLDWSRLQKNHIELNLESFEMEEVIQTAVSHLSGQAKMKSIRMSVQLADGVVVYADKQMITTVVRNLVSNAIKFSNPGSLVTIVTMVSDGCVICHVRDTGVGIGPEVIAVIFDMNQFFTTPGTGNESGTGLGLPICYEFVKKHGGDIWAESKLGEGSCFSFSLPLQTVDG